MSLKGHGPSAVPAELRLLGGLINGIWGGIEGYRRNKYKLLGIGSRLWALSPPPWYPSTKACFPLARGACPLSPLTHAFLSLQPGFHTAGLVVEFQLIFMPSSSLSSPLHMATRSVLCLTEGFSGSSTLTLGTEDSMIITTACFAHLPWLRLWVGMAIGVSCFMGRLLVASYFFK